MMTEKPADLNSTIHDKDMKRNMVIPKGDDFLPDISKKRMESMLKAEKDHKIKSRLLVLVMRKEGYTIRKIEKTLLQPYSTIRCLLVRVARNGLDGIHDQKRDGPKCRLNADQLAQLRADLIAGPRQCGFDAYAWTARLAILYVQKKFGVQYTRRGMYDLLHSMDFSYYRSRHPKAVPSTTRTNLKKQLYVIKRGLK